MRKHLWLAAICLAFAFAARAQEFSLPETAAADEATLSKAMPDLARQVLAVYKEGDRETYLDHLFRLQIVAGQYEDALKTIASLRELLKASHLARASWVNVQYEVYAHAKMLLRKN